MSESMSCIVPVYNGARFLGEALDSILAQTMPPAEIIVIDDGSTDDSAATAERYASRIRYVRQQNAGPAAARNHGLRVAGADWLCFLDADDIWHREKLERQARALEANSQSGICLAHVQNFWVEELAHERERLKDHPFSKPVPGYVCQAMLTRRSVFDAIGPFDENLRMGEDTDWFVRARGAGVQHEILAETLVYRRIHGQNISFQIHNSQEARAALLENVIKNRKQQRARAAENGT
jgi:glycosyltransferase involved in cell wall biosynthesis